MIFRGKNGKLYEINKKDYLNEKEYNKAIMAIKCDKKPVIMKLQSSKEEIINIIKTSMSK